MQVPRRVANRNARARMRLAASRQNDDDEDEELDELAEHIALPDGKIGAKKRKKLEMKAEKKIQREADLDEREERKKRQELLDEQRKKEDLMQKMEDEERVEIEKKEQEERERKEHEEYLLMKEAFTVDQEGFDETEAEKESQSLLQEFIDHVKLQKVVILEELAARFNLKTQEVINRIQKLLEEEKLMGVIDDRGKFIYISLDELKSVAKFIRQRGRISKAELAENSNKLVNFDAVQQPVASA
ncbi:DDRGK domain-containing protein 1 [Nymphon striatum]|nr:DDRGK domain-containing protein 1 [Nymphon striatum]